MSKNNNENKEFDTKKHFIFHTEYTGNNVQLQVKGVYHKVIAMVIMGGIIGTNADIKTLKETTMGVFSVVEYALKMQKEHDLSHEELLFLLTEDIIYPVEQEKE